MVRVAVAGATTGLGLTFLRILALDQEALKKHSFILLSRSQQPDWTARGFDVRQVDYDDHDQLTKALEGVHTVLSFIGGSGEVMLKGQLALIKASKDAGVTRFAPSEYAGDAGHDTIEVYRPKGEVIRASIAAGLQTTQFQVGLFMGILGTGTPKPLTDAGRSLGFKTGEEEALGGLRPWNYVINVLRGTCDNIGDGSAEFVLTDTRDVARYVIAALDMPHWPEKLGMRGSVTSFKHIVAHLETVQNRKFLTRSSTVESVEQQARDDPTMRFYNETRLAVNNGWAMVKPDLNQAFPHIKPTTMEEYIEKWWSGVKLPDASWSSGTTFEPNSK